MKSHHVRSLPAAVALSAIALAACSTASWRRGDSAASTDWSVYGGSPGGDRYSPLAQINRATVSGLEVVWRHDAGIGDLQMSPLVVGGVLYATTTTQQVIALDAATGGTLWQYEPTSSSAQPMRGLSWWSDGADRRLFAASGAQLVALDPATGRAVDGFGDHGHVDLRAGLGRDPAEMAVYMTSPGVIYRDLIIVGFRTSETRPAAPGAVRAYDVRTGKLRWTFNLIPRPGEAGHDSWPAEAWRSAGGANAWAGMVVDPARGIVYVPTGSATDDFVGTDRHGNNLYANSLVALDAATGQRRWHFQTVHHDLWDRDLPSPPVLLTVNRNGKRIDAVAQPTKQGVLFLFDRTTGKPLFGVEERPVAPSDIPGEASSPTQPFPLKPAPFARQRLTADMLTNRTPAANAAARAAFANFRSNGPFTPLGLDKQTVAFPGFDGGAEWGGSAVDRPRGVLYVNSSDIAWTGGLAVAATAQNMSRGSLTYTERCSGCHGLKREGAPPEFPALADVGSRLTAQQIAAIITNGRGRMPGFPDVRGADQDALIAYLRGDSAASDKRELDVPAAAKAAPGTGYRFTGYRKFLDADGYPAVAPPWGNLSAIDLNSGEYLWRVPLGEYPELTAQGIAPTGTENYGGPIVTGGLVFIGATVHDRKFRAFDSRTGQLLWQAQLPYAGVATPITYMAGGRQFIVIAASGKRDPKSPKGSAYIAFALPKR